VGSWHRNDAFPKMEGEIQILRNFASFSVDEGDHFKSPACDSCHIATQRSPSRPLNAYEVYFDVSNYAVLCICGFNRVVTESPCEIKGGLPTSHLHCALRSLIGRISLQAYTIGTLQTFRTVHFSSTDSQDFEITL
jgi:hypothetical protein